MRADHIGDFREELARLEQEGALALTNEQRQELERHLAAVSARRSFPGRRLVWVFGALGLGAAIWVLLNSFWSALPTALQVGVLAGAPAAALWLTGFAARRERTRFLTSLAAMGAFVCFIVDLNVLGAIFNVLPSPHPCLAWAAFALILAYAYRLPMLLAAGLVSTAIWVAAGVATLGGLYWSDWTTRAENILAAGLVVLGASALPQRRIPEFRRVYRLIGLAVVSLGLLWAALDGSMSYLWFPPRAVATWCRLLGLAASAGAIAVGIRRRKVVVAGVGAAFAAVLLYLSLHGSMSPYEARALFFTFAGLIVGGALTAFPRVRWELGIASRWGVPAATAMALAANTFVLLGVAVNRSAVVQRIELTERELYQRYEPERDTTVVLAPSCRYRSQEEGFSPAKLAGLGLTCGVPPQDRTAAWCYRKLPARKAFTVLEYDGPNWRAFLARMADSQELCEDARRSFTRLNMVDAGIDPAALRRQYPDRAHYLIVPSLVSAQYYDPESSQPSAFAAVAIWPLPGEIHVPQPYATVLARARRKGSADAGPRFRLTLCFGKQYELWVCGCDAYDQ